MDSSSTAVELNVGGVHYTTSERTLASEPFFAKLFSTPSTNGTKLFIDRDGILFRYILDYLRNKQLVLPENFTEFQRLRCEASYFQLTALTRLIDEVHSKQPQQQQIGSMMNALSLNSGSGGANSAASGISGKKSNGQNGTITIGYRGTFANTREGLSEVKFRKIFRIFVCGRVQLCREVFDDALNER